MVDIDLEFPRWAPAERREHARATAGRARVSVIVPAYQSHRTIAACLEALGRQEYRDFELLVIDSSPDDRTASAVRGVAPGLLPRLRFVRSRRRLLPHAARNLGVARTGGELLVFIDPDVYPRPDWLGALVAAHDAGGGPVVGSLACHGDRWLDRGIHLCKFSKWLPSGEPRPVDMSPTANMLIERDRFEASGGFDGDLMLGDALLSWRLLRAGAVLRFEPRAEVAHHHLSTLRGFLRERYGRGVLFGELRDSWTGLSRRRSLLYLAASLLPVRLARIGYLVAGHCRAAGETRTLLATLPVVLLGHAASLLGESRAYLARLGRLRGPGIHAEGRNDGVAPETTRA